MPSHVVDMGSMAVLVGMVALGLEKVSMDRSQLSKQLRDLQKKITVAIAALDTEISYVDEETRKTKIAPLCNNEEVHFLLSICKHPDRRNYPISKRFQWWFHRNFVAAPLLPIMQRGIHVHLISLLTSLSVICFLFQKWGEVYDMDHIGAVAGLQDAQLYWVYGATIFGTLFFAVVAHILAGVEPRCDMYLEEFHRQKKHEDKNSRDRMLRELQSYNPTTPPSGHGSSRHRP